MIMLLSVITVSYNSERTIAETLRSVSQVKEQWDVEYIVVDGGSKDGTLHILENHTGVIDKMISEEDTGIYNAMNKGLAMANGEYVAFLNSDDSYLLEGIRMVMAELSRGLFDYISGNLLIIRGRLKEVRAPLSFEYSRSIGFFVAPFFQPAFFLRKSVFEHVGEFDESLKISGDTDFFIRLLQRNEVLRGVHLQKAVTRFDLGGISNNKLPLREHLYIRRKNKVAWGPFLSYYVPFLIKRLVYKMINLRVVS